MQPDMGVVIGCISANVLLFLWLVAFFVNMPGHHFLRFVKMCIIYALRILLSRSLTRDHIWSNIAKICYPCILHRKFANLSTSPDVYLTGSMPLIKA